MHSLYWIILFAIGTVVTGQEPQKTVVQESQSEEDLVHFGDVIDVDVVGGFEFDWRGTLTAEGNLDGLDGFSEPVYGLCRTEVQIAADVARVYGKILRNPNVIVTIIDRSNRAVVRLDGGIRMPTRFRLRREVHLRELLVSAGGLTDEASGDITVFRPRNLNCRSDTSAPPKPDNSKIPAPLDNGLQTLNIKISELLRGNPAADPKILSGDMITVTKAVPVYMIGAVNNPRPIYFRSEITLTHAIATAGGLAKEADGPKVSIYRRDGTGTHIIEADLDKIKRGETIDEVLKPFDIIDVAAKGSGKRKYPPALASTENRDHAITNLPLRIIE